MASNNVMDYNNLQLAWSPCQIAKVHRRFSDPRQPMRKMLVPEWCSFHPEQSITIRDSIVWGGMKDLGGDLRIAAGGQLTIHCRTSMPPQGKIIIEPGGELRVDGGVLHQACGKVWQGIIVEKRGDTEGQLTLLNDGKIKDVDPLTLNE